VSPPRVDHLGLGGTIASVSVDGGPGVLPTLTAPQIAASVPGLTTVADVRSTQWVTGPSAALTIAEVVRLRDEIARRVADGARGVVISQGTDTIEETAYLLDLLWAGEAPVVLTGAMRPASAAGADGPANLLASVQVAIDETARGLGVLVVLNDEIHAARFVRKTHSTALDTFRSPAAGPLGRITEGRPSIVLRVVGRTYLQIAADTPTPPVALFHMALGDDGRLLAAAPDLGYAGAVIEGFGGGHVPPAALPALRALVAAMPVVLASRTGAGEVLRSTYLFAGGEVELLAAGLICAGALDGRKARLLLALALAAGLGPTAIRAAFEPDRASVDQSAR
jgi:L-asparaginase